MRSNRLPATKQSIPSRASSSRVENSKKQAANLSRV